MALERLAAVGTPLKDLQAFRFWALCTPTGSSQSAFHRLFQSPCSAMVLLLDRLGYFADSAALAFSQSSCHIALPRQLNVPTAELAVTSRICAVLPQIAALCRKPPRVAHLQVWNLYNPPTASTTSSNGSIGESPRLLVRA